MSEFYDIFNYQRHNPDSAEQLQSPGEDSLANGGMRVSFTRVATIENRDITIHFKAFITTFNETYMCDWTSDKVYGRADAIPIYSNTRRKISLGLAIPAISSAESYENLAKVQQLIQFLYPSYKQKVNESVSFPQEVHSQIITRSPLIRLKFMNMIQSIAAESTFPTRPSSEESASSTEGASPDSYLYDAYSMNGDDGLLGAVTNFIVLHHMGDNTGVVEKLGIVNAGSENEQKQLQAIMPKLIEINLDFEPVHEHPLGWDTEGNFGAGTFQKEKEGQSAVRTYRARPFPYGVFLSDTDIFTSEDENILNSVEAAQALLDAESAAAAASAEGDGGSLQADGSDAPDNASDAEEAEEAGEQAAEDEGRSAILPWRR